MRYETYAFGGIALIIEAATENKNRAATDLRRILSRNHGHFAADGNVSHPFPRKRQIAAPAYAGIADAGLKLVPGADVAEVNRDVEHDVSLTAHDQLCATGEALRSARIELDSNQTTFTLEHWFTSRMTM
jgi:transcriptional/translational regulatory protein YebC/TACO1